MAFPSILICTRDLRLRFGILVLRVQRFETAILNIGGYDFIILRLRFLVVNTLKTNIVLLRRAYVGEAFLHLRTELEVPRWLFGSKRKASPLAVTN
ncbi:hypothetical protein D8674_036619 [Pyrus ussuriensis x Pyrus communis]|uniref:Uncharacterized protein n=1 Tax=Pyrus ussuriensis x Pyrus communis TaxID=2448454 RepID=A0A5N5I473_9ROSA|nr:hypothetical protein D8674_036619 [Pyrus ussuriensis x Pyrus communis]